MADNALLTTTKVSDSILAPFIYSNALLNNANMQPTKDFTDAGLYGIGGTLQMRKYPRYFVNEQDISTIPPGSITLTPQAIQQETETLTIEKLFDITVNLNGVQRALQLKTDQAWNDFVVKPFINAMGAKIMPYLYSKLLSQLYIFVGDGTSRLNTITQVTDAGALMTSAQMPKNRIVIMSPQDGSSFLGTYAQNNYSTRVQDEIWDTGFISHIGSFDVYEDENIRIHQAGTAAGTGGVTLLVAASDGDTTLQLTGLTPGTTVKVDDKLQLITTAGTPGENVYLVPPLLKDNIISNTLYPITFIVAPGTGGNPDYASGVYTVPGSGNLTVSIVNPVRTNITVDQYAYISAPSDQIPISTGINLIGSHRVNPALCVGNCLTVGAPPVAKLTAGAITKVSNIDGIAVNCMTQSQVTFLQDIFAAVMQIGCLVHGEYGVGILSAP